MPATTTGPRPQSAFSRWANRHRRWLFAGPAMLFIAALIIFPIIWTAWLSLTDASGSVRAEASFIGLENYAKVLTDTQRFWPAVGRTALFTGVVLFFEMLFGLCIALLLALRAAGMPRPAGAVGISPWVDLTLAGNTLAVNEPTDFLNADILRATARMYAAGHDARDPLMSPLYADLAGLPPLLIQAGSAEMLLDDSRRFATRAQVAGVDATLEVYEHMVHVWHFTWMLEPKARQALDAIGRFVRQRVPVA